MLYFRKAWDSRISNITFLWFYPDFCAKNPIVRLRKQTVGLQHLSWSQLSRGPTVRGPAVRGPICLEPSVFVKIMLFLGTISNNTLRLDQNVFLKHISANIEKTSKNKDNNQTQNDMCIVCQHLWIIDWYGGNLQVWIPIRCRVVPKSGKVDSHQLSPGVTVSHWKNLPLLNAFPMKTIMAGGWLCRNAAAETFSSVAKFSSRLGRESESESECELLEKILYSTKH